MTTTVPHTRRRHQRRIAALLDELEQRRQRLYLLQAGGARPAGLRDLKAELHALRDELAAAVDGAGRHDDLAPSTRDARLVHAAAD
jgi:hypothetical protein